MMHNGTGHVPPPPVPPPGPPQPPVSNNNNGHQPEPPLQNGTIATGMDARLVPNYESLVPAAAVIRRVAGHLNLMLSKLMLRQSRNRNSTDQRMEVLEHVASARLLLAKTMAALAWAREGRAGAYVTAQALISMLDNQITAFEFAAMKLADTARVLAQQAEASRNPDVPTAVDVLASGSYLRFPLTLTNTLPNGFLPLPAPDDDADDEDVNAHAGSVTLTTDTIHDAIRYRLVTLEPAIPDVWLANHVISNGQVTFISPGAFAVSLTLPLGHDPKGKWALTDLTILDTNVVMRPDHHFALMQLGRHTLEKVVAPEQAHVPGATSAAGTGPTATATGGGAGHAATPPPALPLLELHGMYHAIVQSLRFERLQHDATHMLARFPRSMSQPRVTHLTSMRVERDMSIEYWAGSKLSHTLEIMLRPAAASATRRLVNLSGMLAAEKDAAPTARVVSAEVDTNNVEVLLSHRGRVAMVPPNVTMEDLFMACLAEDSQRALQQFARMLGANAVFRMSPYFFPSNVDAYSIYEIDKGSLRFVDHHFVVSITRDKGYLHVDTVNGYHPKDTIKQLTSAIVNDPLQLEEGLLQLRVTKLLNDLENECQLAGLIPSSPTRKNRWHLVFARANAAPPLVLDEQFVVKVLEAPRLPLYRLVLFPDEQGVGYSCIVGHLYAFFFLFWSCSS
ncbi:mediator complex subunit MED14-domain-containing protein [Blastocladiella britannica]|nr:mediator complex subunit MED14-domain-containing protein [Blastocladiella britannica]